MKINLIFFLARFGFGGAGNSVFKLCKSLDKKKYNIHVICLNKCAYKKQLRNETVKVIEINSNRVLYSVFKLKKIIKKITKDNKDNIFISNINYTNIVCSIFLKNETNLKLIAIERTPFKELEIYFSVIDYIKKSSIKILTHIFYKRFDAIVCNSKYMGNYLKKKYGYKSITIYPPSLNEKQIIKKNKRIKKSILLTTVCRLSREKKIEEMIYALKYLNKNSVFLNIIGDGPERKKLIFLIKKLDLSKQVKLLGEKKNIYKYLNKSDLYINSSYFEGFPNSVVEAANMGIPIISSQSHGGINEILLNGKCGTIYDNGYKNLAIQIKNFLNNPKNFEIKSKIAKKNVARFTILKHKQKFEKLLEKI